MVAGTRTPREFHCCGLLRAVRDEVLNRPGSASCLESHTKEDEGEEEEESPDYCLVAEGSFFGSRP